MMQNGCINEEVTPLRHDHEEADTSADAADGEEE